MDTKRCNTCNNIKILSEFNKRKDERLGVSGRCRLCEKVKAKNWRNLNPNYSSDWRKRNILRSKEIKNRWKNKNKDYNKNRAKIDLEYKLINNIRSRFCMALKNNTKTGSSIIDLGCSIQHLKLHIELFWDEGMTWNNYGKGPNTWSIDHIKPLSSFDLTDRNKLLEALNFKNLQPLWSSDNSLKWSKSFENFLSQEYATS